MTKNPADFFRVASLTSTREAGISDQAVRFVRCKFGLIFPVDTGSDMLKNAFCLRCYHYSSYYLSEWFNE